MKVKKSGIQVFKNSGVKYEMKTQVLNMKLNENQVLITEFLKIGYSEIKEKRVRRKT